MKTEMIRKRKRKQKMINCSIGVIVYNEEKNIAKLLDALLSQKLNKVCIKELFVVSSACTDRTDEIVREYEKKDDRIKLITEPERRGKSAAINMFIDEAESEVLVIESGDTIPAPTTVEKMVSVFENPEVGMSGGRPLPENPDKTLVGYAVNIMWHFHHIMALHEPKLGEMIAFRNVVSSIPEESAVDEASIEAVIKEKGLKKVYIPSAIVHNKGPENIKDFIKQRRRIAAGHIWLKKEHDYEVTSQNSMLLIEIMLAEIAINPLKTCKLAATMMLEVYSRIMGWIDFNLLNKNPFKWDIAESTKNLSKKV